MSMLGVHRLRSPAIAINDSVKHCMIVDRDLSSARQKHSPNGKEKVVRHVLIGEDAA